MPIKTIIFDLGGVLIELDFKRAFTAMEGFCEYRAAEIPPQLRKTDLIWRFETGHISSEDFAQEFCELLNLKCDYAQFCAIWTNIFSEITLVPASLLESLASHYRLILLSNTNPIHFQMLQQTYPILKCFDDSVLSYRVGALKPSPLLYREAVRKAGCVASECFLTDDMESCVEAATVQGIDAVRFENSSQLKHELQTRGVVF